MNKQILYLREGRLLTALLFSLICYKLEIHLKNRIKIFI